MRFSRASGILLHPTSLPGPGGIGSLGPAAGEFLETMARAGQGIWQILPLGPPGVGNSPYQSFSAFAGSPLLISPEWIVEDGLASPDDATPPPLPEDRVDFGAAIAFRRGLLEKAWRAFRNGDGPGELNRRFEEFRERESAWLDDLALFLAIKESEETEAWTEWSPELARREEDALRDAREKLHEAVDRELFVQFLFFEHWARVREKAKDLGIEILGDLPIFVSADSADVWAHADLFDLEESGRPRVVAGVPPDYFSETGQLWGNPLYRWEVHSERGYDWWIDRMRASLAMYDRVRIDHFRGFQDYWEIPGGEETAVNGRWVPGPGAEFFEALETALGELPIVAEDLGILTDAVYELRDRFAFPGMRVLQFGFNPEPRTDPHTPHQFVANCVAYTGTHDNDTVRGWFEGVENDTETEDEKEARRDRVLRYTGTDGSEIHWDLIRLTLLSVADTAIVPMQDVLGLGGEARMNVPGRPDGNWAWRMKEGAWTEEVVERLGQLTEAGGRWR